MTDPTSSKPAPKLVDLEAIRREREAAEARARAEEEESSGGGPPGGDGGGGESGIDSKLLGQCLHLNNAGDAEIYRRLHDGRYIYNNAMGKWLRWQGHHWEIDYMNEALGAVQDVAELYDQEAWRLKQEIERDYPDAGSHARNCPCEGCRLKRNREAMSTRAKELRGRKRRDDCLHFAATHPVAPMAIRGDELDQNPWLMACANGVIDLRAGELRPGRQDDYLLKASPVEWQGIGAPRERWLRFLSEIFEGNDDLVAFLQRLLGCALPAMVTEHIFACFKGQGRNGKGTIVETVCAILGEMAGPIRSEMLLDNGMVRSAAGPSPDIMGLRGLRMAFASETDKHVKLSTSRVKWLTGADTLRARNPNDKFEVVFSPTHTLFMMTNNLPHAPSDDFAFWERVMVVPFGLSYVRRRPNKPNERPADPDLPRDLLREAPGILAWLVEGCLRWQERGLDPPPIVMDEVADYRRNEDILAEFIEDCLILVEDDTTGVPSSEVYTLFCDWWILNMSKYPLTQKKFGALMKLRFRREKVGVIRYYGFAIDQEAAIEVAVQLDAKKCKPPAQGKLP